jgi:hypothetical protein
MMAKIEREAAHAPGKPARIIAKMNALTEEHVVQTLYRASQAGVEIDLIVRGMRASAGHSGRVGTHPRALDHRPLSRTQPRLLVPER